MRCWAARAKRPQIIEAAIQQAVGGCSPSVGLHHPRLGSRIVSEEAWDKFFRAQKVDIFKTCTIPVFGGKLL